VAAPGRDDLVASYYTLTGTPVGAPARFSFDERVAAAGAAGFTGIGLHFDDYAALRAEGRDDAELRSVLDAHGVRVMEIEFLFDWACTDERAQQAAATEATLLAMADAFGPHHVNVGDINPATEAPPFDHVVERFAGICDRAAEHDTRVAFEFLPWSSVPDLAAAEAIVRAAGRDNAGVVLDAWHWFRGNPDDGALAQLPAEHVVCVQLDDGDAEPVGPYTEDTMFRRRLPGEGTFDLVGLVRRLDALGVDVPISVEIMSTDEQALPVGDAARRAHDSTAAVLARARGR
jgi:sugar phosphate isomerase/epimerase